MTSVDRMTEGAEARLVEVGGHPPLRRRLMEMGLLPGTPLKLIRRLELGGVLELEVRRSRLSLRHGEATLLLVAQD